jgi:hypothetical protein
MHHSVEARGHGASGTVRRGERRQNVGLGAKKNPKEATIISLCFRWSAAAFLRRSLNGRLGAFSASHSR